MLRWLLVLMALVSGPAFSLDVKTFIPEKAKIFAPVMISEIIRIMPETPSYGYFGALTEKESCITLVHKRCWDPTSELKTSREQGVGLGMITRAYRKDGSLRFDALKELRDKNSQELKEASWLTIKTRPDLQIRMIILMIKASYNRLVGVKDKLERLAMADSAYNGGDGGLAKDRTQCGLTKGCDPQKWFGNVENIKIKSTVPIYGGDRSPWVINREHTREIMIDRRPKYEKFFETLR